MCDFVYFLLAGEGEADQGGSRAAFVLEGTAQEVR